MNDRDQRRYDRATRVRTFGIENAADFVPGSKATTLFASVNSRIKQCDEAKAGQFPARVSKETLLDALSLDLQNIARTAARGIGRYENGFAAAYRMPDSSTEQAITTHADAVLPRLEDQPDDSAATKAAKAALRARFIEYELPADFVVNLRAGRNAITETNTLNQGKTQDGVENTELIGQVLGGLSDDIMELNVIMHNKYARQPEKLRAWESASHVECAPQKEKKVITLIADKSSTTQPKVA
jgi:hypothetical protein